MSVRAKRRARRRAWARLLIGAAGMVPMVLGGAPAAMAANPPSAPGLQAPAPSLSVQSVPSFEWGRVQGAGEYQFELAADRHFGSIVWGIETHNTAAAPDKALPNGTYYWRVRAFGSAGQAGRWSAMRTMVKAWNEAPRLLGPTKTTVRWPSQPLVFRWSSVPHAYQYRLTVATDPRLGNQVIGSATSPIITQGTVYTPGAPLSAGRYFWAVTPMDSEGNLGRRSVVGAFTYSWPTVTPARITDARPEPSIFDPVFSWNPVPGAAHYQVEVSSAADFPTGSIWCCTDTTLGNSLAPTQEMANNAYYWRVRAIDARGDAGVWNYGPHFTKAFDDLTPSIPNLRIVDTSGTALPTSGAAPVSTDTPIVTWDPVPGASRYEIQVVPHNSIGCEWSAASMAPYVAETASTAWTPLGDVASHIGPSSWPTPQYTIKPLPTDTAYCVRVLARSDNDAHGGQVVSPWTQIDGDNQAAFYYAAPPSPGTPGPGLTMPSANYILPASGTVTPRTPYFTWQRVTGAQGYYVVISRDAQFTDIADVGFTNVPAYAPQLFNDEPLRDETTSYYWAVLPTQYPTEYPYGMGEYSSWDQDSPQTFNKSSVPPTLLAPASRSTISTQPTFHWTGAENARNYTLEVSPDPSFGDLLDDVTTDQTVYTSNTTYPADKRLYWRVQANDWVGHGLNWSATHTFVRTLPAPVPSRLNAKKGEGIPLLRWAPVPGATGYDVHVDWINGRTWNYTVSSPALTFNYWYGPGIWHWEVRADFPTASSATTSSGYSAAQSFVRLLKAPTGARGVRGGGRALVTWNPNPAAKQYEVEIAPTNGFSTTISTQRTDNTSWAPDLNPALPQEKGKLYWRVAAVDGYGNVGTFAMGRFK